MGKKDLPLIVMLVAGAVTCIITFVKNYSVLGKLVSLFVVLLIFYILGSILEYLINKFEKQNEEKKKAEEQAAKEAEEKAEAERIAAEEAAKKALEESKE